MTTIACVYVHGHVKDFRPEYVVKLASMVKRHMDRPYRFVCLTDQPEKLYVRGIDIVGIPPPARLLRPMPYGYPAGRNVFGWWSKLQLFNPAHGFTGRVLSIDLDTLIVDALAPILDYPAEFALVPDAGTFVGKFGLRLVKRFNSSVMTWDADSPLARRVWEAFTPEVPMTLWGDQDHIGQQVPEAATMPIEWFPRISALKETPADPPVKVVLCKYPKNAIASEWYPWVREVWV